MLGQISNFSSISPHPSPNTRPKSVEYTQCGRNHCPWQYSHILSSMMSDTTKSLSTAGTLHCFYGIWASRCFIPQSGLFQVLFVFPKINFPQKKLFPVKTQRINWWMVWTQSLHFTPCCCKSNSSSYWKHNKNERNLKLFYDWGRARNDYQQRMQRENRKSWEGKEIWELDKVIKTQTHFSHISIRLSQSTCNNC